MAALIRSLAVSGSRKSDGTPNVSGKVFLYSPGTTTIVPGYMDDQLSEAWTTVGGGIALDAGGRVEIWLNDVVDVVVSDSSGTTVDTWLGFNRTRAEQVEIEDDNVTGALTDSSGAVSQALGGKTDLATFISRGVASLGPDFEYQESPGATPRPWIEVIRGMQVSVKDFSAVGNGIADDTTAVQGAVSEAKRLGAGVVFFDEGTYKTSGVPIALANATGIEFRGVGQGASILSQSTAATNAITVTSCTDFTIRNMAVVGPVVMTDAVRPLFENVTVSGGTYGLNIGGTLSTDVVITNCVLTGTTRSLLLANTVRANINGGQFNNLAGTAIEYSGSTSRVLMFGARFAATTGVVFNAALTGLHFVIAGCPDLGANTVTSVDMTGLAALPNLRQWGNNVDASATSGANQTPVLYRGQELILTSTVGAVAVNAPAILPGTAATDVDLHWDAVFKNAAGAPVAWTLNAVFVLAGAVAIPNTDAHTIMVRFRWDRTTSKLRECSRSDTAT